MNDILAPATIEVVEVLTCDELGELWIQVRSDDFTKAEDTTQAPALVGVSLAGYEPSAKLVYSDLAGAWDDDAHPYASDEGYDAWWIFQRKG